MRNTQIYMKLLVMTHKKKSNPDCLLQKGKYCFIVFISGTDLVELNFVVGFLGDITYHTYTCIKVSFVTYIGWPLRSRFDDSTW